jgi:hypothetical protein
MRHTIVTIAALAGLSIAGLTVAACSSSGSSSSSASSSTSTTTTSGIETLHGTDTGSAAAADLNNSNPNAPLQFTAFTYSGPVNLTVKPFTLPTSNGPNGTNTLPGGMRVHHVSSLPSSSSNAPPPATWTLKGGNCYFVTTFDKGTYTVVSGSTGKFTGATGHGSYQITATGSAPLAKGKTACSFNNIGPVSTQGASITFIGSGPLTVM